MNIKYTGPLRGELEVPGDKSISHRSVMLGALADGTTEITHFLTGADCLSTIACFRQMGIEIEQEGEHVLVHGKGLHGLQKPAGVLDAGNSGTTVRLLSGILAGQAFDSVITGDASIRKRPMKRIMEPLRKMGARITSAPAGEIAAQKAVPCTGAGNKAAADGTREARPCARADNKAAAGNVTRETRPWAGADNKTAAGNITRETRLWSGADNKASETGCAPLSIHGGGLHGISYVSPVASAQVKSCVLLAGLYADGPTSVTEPAVSRNHSELMLRYFGADVRTEGRTAAVLPEPALKGRAVRVPGDISSAAYFIAAALLVPGSELLLKNVGINPTRDGMLRVCRAMGADITLLNEDHRGAEPCADLLVRSSSLKGTMIEGDLIPTLIDELPVLAVMAAFADGTTVIRDAAELRVKESDRIAVMTENLNRIGCPAEALPDGMIIPGGHALHEAVIDTKKDHRVAMSFAVAALGCQSEMELIDGECVRISYPGFYEDLARMN